MARYLIETRGDVSCCFDCPLFSCGYECELEHRDNRDNADEKPEWCPMMEFESDPSVMAMKEQIRALESKIHRQREAIAELTRRERWHDKVSTSKGQQILSLTRLVSELCDLVEWKRMGVDAIAPIAHEMEALGICAASEFYTIALMDKSRM